MSTKYIFPVLKELDKSYPIYVVTVGKENQSFINRPNGIPDHQLLFTTRGCGEIVLDGKKISVSENSVMYLKPNTPQYYYPVSDEWSVIWVTYAQNRAFEILSAANGVYNLSSVEPYVNILSLMLKGKGTLNFGKNASMLLYNLLIELKDHLRDTHHLENRSILQPAVEYIENNYSLPIEITYLAELAGVSTEHFCRVFKKTHHMRPLEYIQILRLQKAKQKLITHTDLSVAQIAESVGYPSPSYFIKLFKAAEKTTPIQFRKQYMPPKT